MNVKYEQLTDVEKRVMKLIWDSGGRGFPFSVYEVGQWDAVTGLINFDLIHESFFGKYKFTLLGRQMMVEQYLKERS